MERTGPGPGLPEYGRSRNRPGAAPPGARHQTEHPAPPRNILTTTQDTTPAATPQPWAGNSYRPYPERYAWFTVSTQIHRTGLYDGATPNASGLAYREVAGT